MAECVGLLITCCARGNLGNGDDDYDDDVVVVLFLVVVRLLS